MLPHEQVAANVRSILSRRNIKYTQLTDVLEPKADAIRLKMNGKTPLTLDEVGLLAKFLELPFTTLIEGAEGYAKPTPPAED